MTAPAHPGEPESIRRPGVDGKGSSPHPLQSIAQLVYLSAAAALLIWTVREQVPRFRVRELATSVGYVLYAALLGLAVIRPRADAPPSAGFEPTLVLVVLHALVGLSGSVCLAAYGSFGRALEGAGSIPLVACWFALLAGPFIGLMLLLTARRAGSYMLGSVGVFLWLGVAGALFG